MRVVDDKAPDLRCAERVGKENPLQNLSMLRKITLTNMRADKTDTRKSSFWLKRKGLRRMTGYGSACWGSGRHARGVQRPKP